MNSNPLGKLFNKKVGIIIVLVPVIIFIFLNWITYNTAGLLFWDTFATNPLTPEEIEEKRGTFTPNPPDTIKGVWEPQAMHLERMLIFDVDRIKEMGVNTVSLSLDYNFNPDGSYFTIDRDKTLSNLVRAKELGFAIHFMPSLGRKELYDFEKEGIDMTKEKFLDKCDEIAVETAKIAEDFGVEFYSPMSELDGIVQTNFAGDVPWEERFEETAIVVGAWYKRILPKVKAVYKGKVATKFGRTEQEMADRADDYMGYDIIGTSSGHANFGMEHFKGDTIKEFNRTSYIAKVNNCTWAVVEAWFPIGGPFWPVSVNEDGESLDQLQDEYFRVSIEEYMNYNENAVGYVFHSWTMPISPVKDRPSEQLLKDFFSNIQNPYP